MPGLMTRTANLRLYLKHVENWWDIVLDFYGMKKEDYVLKCRNGIRCWAQPGQHDYGVLMDVVVENTYLPEISGFGISKGDVVFDIGANTGIFSLAAAKEGARVFAFEPSQRNYSMLLRNLKLNELSDKVTPVKKAVADKEGKIKLFTGPHHTTHSLFQDLSTGSDAFETVEVTTLGAAIEEHGLDKIDLLKMDCEGAEYAILYGSSPDILRKIDRISMEYHEFDDNSAESLVSFLKKHGFRVQLRPKTERIGFIFAWRGK